MISHFVRSKDWKPLIGPNQKEQNQNRENILDFFTASAVQSGCKLVYDWLFTRETLIVVPFRCLRLTAPYASKVFFVARYFSLVSIFYRFTLFFIPKQLLFTSVFAQAVRPPYLTYPGLSVLQSTLL